MLTNHRIEFEYEGIRVLLGTLLNDRISKKHKICLKVWLVFSTIKFTQLKITIHTKLIDAAVIVVKSVT